MIFLSPSESVVYSLWHMCGSLVLLRGLDAVVAAAAAEETEVALTVPFEAAVAFALCSIAPVAAGALASVLVSRSDASESFGCSAEKSPGKQFVSIKDLMKSMAV